MEVVCVDITRADHAMRCVLSWMITPSRAPMPYRWFFQKARRRYCVGPTLCRLRYVSRAYPLRLRLSWCTALYVLC